MTASAVAEGARSGGVGKGTPDGATGRSGPAAWCRAAVKEGLEHAAHLLPEQAPLHAFVHHNTLHAFEDLPFERAVEQAAAFFDAEPYPTERALSSYLQAGSIAREDVRAVVEEEYALTLQNAELGGLELRDFLVERLLHPFELPGPAAVRYQLSEGLVTSRFHELTRSERRAELEALARTRYPGQPQARERLLEALWSALERATPKATAHAPRIVRRSTQLRSLGVEDADGLAIPHLIRLAAAYLDQGVSSWPMPERERGFYRCFRQLYRSPLGVLEKWLQPLDAEMRRQEQADYRAEDACVWALERLAVPIEKYGPYIEATLLALPGWAGMFRTVELHPEKCPVAPVSARLLDFLAVALVLEAHAATFVLEAHARTQGDQARWSMSELEQKQAELGKREPDIALTYEAFVLAQMQALDLSALLDRGLSDSWLEWVGRLSGVTRRRLLWRALERHHLLQLTSGLSEHVRFLRGRVVPKAEFQAVFCIDDREESYRRHLEETEPGAMTFSYPGFFGVAMRFHAHGQIRPRDLCPVVLKATHVVREVPKEGSPSAPAFRVGLAPHRHRGSTTLARGFLFSLLGVLAIVPLVGRVLFPRWFHRREKKAVLPPTELRFERLVAPAAGELPEGYSDAEMADVVLRLLGDIGLSSGFAPLVLVIGHGASSVNNPLLAAYGCGATAGGCGGPNARVWCAMANRPSVRALLAERGIEVPASTLFVAGMHDTTTDDVVLYPPAEMSGATRAAFDLARSALDEASRRNAHERCRLFHQVPTTIDARTAKAVVESRSADLAAARPEFNHAKNSCAIVGRRRFTRGLFLDKRAFLVSSDPTLDPEGEALERMIMGSVPVGMGINLEYFFATVDNAHYGSGSKLPHNVSGLMGIMNGHASDLQTGLNSQMVEPHEPIRLVSVIDASPPVLLRILERRPALRRLVLNGWIQLVAWEPELGHFFHFKEGQFRRLEPPAVPLAQVELSIDAYRGQRGSLPLAHVSRGLEKAS